MIDREAFSISCLLTPENYDDLRHYSQQDETTFSRLINKALRQYFQEREFIHSDSLTND